MIQRREFNTLLGGAAATSPLATLAQQRPTHKIGFLSSFHENNSAMRSMATEMFETLT